MVIVMPQRTAHFVDIDLPCYSHCLRLVFTLAAPCGTTVAVDPEKQAKIEY